MYVMILKGIIGADIKVEARSGASKSVTGGGIT